MTKQRLWIVLLLTVVLSLLLAACGGGTTEPAADNAAPVDNAAAEAPADNAAAEAPAADSAGQYQIPAIEDGKYNVAFVYVGPHDDGGWSQAHDVGRQYVEANVENVHTAYVENVAEGADAEQVIRSLARKGFDVIFTTSFGFMDASEVVANEFPDVDIIHICGYKSNGENFGNLMGAMENMKYLAGMLAGSRTKMDNNTKIGYIATFPIPEELRLGNAFALGVQQTCPDCTIDVRWIFTWHDPILEKEGASSLFDAGAQVVMTGADTPAPADAAPEVNGVSPTTIPATAPRQSASLRCTGTGDRNMRALLKVLVKAPGEAAGNTSMLTAARWACLALWKAKRCSRA